MSAAPSYSVSVSTRFSRIGMIVLAAIVLTLVFAPTFLARTQIQDLILILLLVGLAQCWNLLAGYAGLISVGQQAYVGLGAYALYYAVNIMGMNPMLGALMASVFVALLSIPIGLVVFRLQGAYFAVVTWVVAEICRLLSAVYPTLGGGSGASLQNPTSMWGVARASGLRSRPSRTARSRPKALVSTSRGQSSSCTSWPRSALHWSGRSTSSSRGASRRTPPSR
jgi:branched-chain amino acid transport system permease protein